MTLYEHRELHPRPSGMNRDLYDRQTLRAWANNELAKRYDEGGVSNETLAEILQELVDMLL